jgi:hypothetical protein
MTGDDLFRIDATLTRLEPYLRSTPFALAGSIAIDYHLLVAKRLPPEVPVTDLDLVLGRLDALAPAVTGAFLVSHYHTAGPDTKPMIQLVDPQTRLRVDLYPDADGAIRLATRVTLGRSNVLLLGTRSILEHKLRVLRTSTPGRPVDPKHAADAKVLAEISRLAIPPLRPALAPDRYETEVDVRCTRCERSRSAAFPLAPKPQILDLLGYV